MHISLRRRKKIPRYYEEKSSSSISRYTKKFACAATPTTGDATGYRSASGILLGSPVRKQ